VIANTLVRHHEASGMAIAHWLKARPFLYLVSHMLIMPLIDLFVTATEWLTRAGSPPAGLWLFLLLSFANGCVLEIGPGQALSRMWNQRYPDTPARSCDDFRSASAVTDWIMWPPSRKGSIDSNS
jgi:hypothetical protein